MTREELKEFCLNIKPIKLSVTKNPQELKFKECLLSETKFLDFYNKVPLTLRYYCILNDVVEIPTCLCCDSPVTYKKDYPDKGFAEYCSPTCSRSDKTVPKEILKFLSDRDWLYEQRITLKKSKALIASELKISTIPISKWLSIHGIENKKDGVKNTKEPVPEKDILYNLYYNDELTLLDISKKFNVSNTLVKKWFIDYGIKLLPHNQIIKTRVVPKIAKTNIQKYGIAHLFSSKEFQLRIQNANLQKYGVRYNPNNNSSKTEISIKDYLNTIIPGFEKNTSAIGMEIDMLNLNYNIGIEYCGLRYHTVKTKSADSHFLKYKKAKEHGIRLFTIFDNEWKQSKSQIISFILASVGIYDRKIFARKCEFIRLPSSNKDAHIFYDINHIQGSPYNSICHYALIYENNIVACLTIGTHHRYTNQLCLTRYCVESGTQIIGGADKLFSYVKTDLKGELLKTWSDNRFTEGELYNRLGFTLSEELSKDYFYYNTDKNIIKSKQSMKLPKKYSGDKTEEEFSKNLGFYRVWDCGKKRWEIQL